MAERSHWWGVAAVIFIVGNVASAIYHVAIGETAAAAGHTGVAVGTLLFWQAVFSRKGEPESTAAPRQLDSRLDHLQHSVDTIALEVERLGEGQRFAQKILQSRLAGEKEARRSRLE